jgi:hypothetical protein
MLKERWARKVMTPPNGGEMNRFKRTILWHTILILVLLAGSSLAVSAQARKLQAVSASAKGRGRISTPVDEQKITSALIFLREDGTFLIALAADIQVQAEGTWKENTFSPDEILLKITGGVLEGEMTGTGKLSLSSDRTSINELTINVKTRDGLEISVTFVGDASEPE